MTTEKVRVGSLFEHAAGKFFAAIYYPDTGVGCLLDPKSLYATGEGPTADDAVHAARAKLWNGL